MVAIKVAADKDFQNANRPINLPPPINSGDAANRGFVLEQIENLNDTLIGLGVPQELDCSTNPNYPLSPPGRVWIVPTGGAGKIGGEFGITVAVGDVIRTKGVPDTENIGEFLDVPSGDQATVGQYFYHIEGNREKATTAKQGLVEIATQAEVDAGTDTDNAVTPATLNQRLLDLSNNSEYTTPIGNGTDTLFTINHGLNDENVDIRVRETASKEYIEAYRKPLTANSIQVGFGVAPSSGFYTVIINKK